MSERRTAHPGDGDGRAPRPWGGWARHAAAVVAVAVVTLLMIPVRTRLDTVNAAFAYLLLSLGLGLVAGPRPAAVGAVLAFLAFDYFFLPPYQTFAIDAEHHVLALLAFLVVALVAGQLVARLRQRTELAERERRRTDLLYDLNAALLRDVTPEQVLAGVVGRVVTRYGATACRLLVPGGDGPGLVVAARHPADAPATVSPAVDRQARRAMDGRRTVAGEGDGSGPPVHWVPVATAERMIGALEVTGAAADPDLREDEDRILATFADQAALAMERARLLEEAARGMAVVESDRLKSTMLAAVSHDLRTPLVAIKASATSLLDRSVAWTEEDRVEFLRAIDEEADRLTEIVGNFLDLSRIEGGVLVPRREWYDLAELVEEVGDRLQGRAEGRPIRSEVPDDLPLALIDYVQIRQVLTNLVENAIKYAPPGEPVEIAAAHRDGVIEVAVTDRGPGIPDAKREAVFEKFVRLGTDRRVAGAGIGLTISKGIVEAHGGRIWVEAGPGGIGTSARFTLPVDGGDDEGGPEA